MRNMKGAGYREKEKESTSQLLHKGCAEAVGLGKAQQGWAKAETTRDGCWIAEVETPSQSRDE